MKRTTILSILAAGAALATFSAPANAALCLSGTYGTLSANNTGSSTTNVTPNATSCVGFFAGNVFGANATNNAAVKAALIALGMGTTQANAINFTTLYADTGSKLSALAGATKLTFGDYPTLFGTTYLGVHWGGAGGGRSEIFKLDLTSPVSFLTILGQNTGGSSNAVIFSSQTYTPPAVPEPASWAMLIAGLGAVGFAMRRKSTDVSFA